MFSFITPIIHLAIRELRERLGSSQAMLAACVGKSDATLIKWELEEIKPNGAAMRLLSIIDRKGLGVLQ